MLGEDLIAFRDTQRQGRLPGQQLPAPRRIAVLRPQRRGRPALRLPRLEVRRRRQLHRHAQRARRVRLQAPRSRPSPTRRRSAAASSGSTWAHPTSSRRCPTTTGAPCPTPPTARCASGCRSPTTARASRATWTQRTCRSCTASFSQDDRPINYGAPRLTTMETDFGFAYGARRPAGDDYFWRVTTFTLPMFVMIPGGRFAGGGHFTLPMDDEHSWWFVVEPPPPPAGEIPDPGAGPTDTAATPIQPSIPPTPSSPVPGDASATRTTTT